jgi:hypothetical protein
MVMKRSMQENKVINGLRMDFTVLLTVPAIPHCCVRAQCMGVIDYQVR